MSHTTRINRLTRLIAKRLNCTHDKAVDVLCNYGELCTRPAAGRIEGVPEHVHDLIDAQERILELEKHNAELLADLESETACRAKESQLLADLQLQLAAGFKSPINNFRLKGADLSVNAPTTVGATSLYPDNPAPSPDPTPSTRKDFPGWFEDGVNGKYLYRSPDFGEWFDLHRQTISIPAAIKDHSANQKYEYYAGFQAGWNEFRETLLGETETDGTNTKGDES